MVSVEEADQEMVVFRRVVFRRVVFGSFILQIKQLNPMWPSDMARFTQQVEPRG